MMLNSADHLRQIALARIAIDHGRAQHHRLRHITTLQHQLLGRQLTPAIKGRWPASVGLILAAAAVIAHRLDATNKDKPSYSGKLCCFQQSPRTFGVDGEILLFVLRSLGQGMRLAGQVKQRIHTHQRLGIQIAGQIPADEVALNGWMAAPQRPDWDAGFGEGAAQIPADKTGRATDCCGGQYSRQTVRLT